MKRLAQQTQEQDINHLLKVRREKLAELQQSGRDPFQITKFDQTHHSLEVKGLYEAHESELLKDRQEPNVEGMDEEQAKEALKKDYEERRNIMDASPIHVSSGFNHADRVSGMLRPQYIGSQFHASLS